MKKQHEHYSSKVWPIIQIACRIVQNDPSIFEKENIEKFKQTLALQVPQLKDKTKCAGCDRSMKVTVYEADLLDALLLLAMAKAVKENIKQGIPFTDANKVHIPTLRTTQGILKRQTKCDYLGFIKQPENWRGTGYWLLTRWAWKALRGEEVPKSVKYWEGKLLGRSEAKTTLQAMFSRHRELVKKVEMKRKAVKADYRAVFADYNQGEWVYFEKIPNQGDEE